MIPDKFEAKIWAISYTKNNYLTVKQKDIVKFNFKSDIFFALIIVAEFKKDCLCPVSRFSIKKKSESGGEFCPNMKHKSKHRHVFTHV